MDEFEAVGAWAPKDLGVSLHEQRLTVTGEKHEKHEEKEEKDEMYHRVERSWGGFARTITLPASVDAEKANATFKDGVLTVTIPKTPPAKGTTVPVKAG